MATTVLTPAVGRWAFIVGLLIAVLVGLATDIPGAAAIIFILGLLVGLLNVPEKESMPFLVAVIALLTLGVAGLEIGVLTPLVSNILTQFVAFVSAAALVVAVKQTLTYARD
ncbi:MAG: hypothetical protein G01um101438_97 [Parcubacteria group bacterium Gr01-1014_38]|nr:MAG: hypothetical protein G01um101438_97 [Parcubacteria group bacterium Gr01-1014_38]